MVVHDAAVDGVIERIEIDPVGSQQLDPWRARELEPAQQVAADIRDRPPPHTSPGVTSAPVAGQRAPRLHGCHAEAGVRLRLLGVLRATHGEQRSLLEAVGDQRHRIGDRKRVAIEEHQEVVVRRLVADLHREMVELGGVQASLLDDSVEVDRV